MDTVCFTGGELTIISALLAALVGTISFLFKLLWDQREQARQALTGQYEARIADLETRRDQVIGLMREAQQAGDEQALQLLRQIATAVQGNAERKEG